jgi:DNA-binding beta-propeller fold protein YncE
LTLTPVRVDHAGPAPVAFGSPSGVAVDAKGAVYVVDALRARVRVLASSTTLP